MTTRCGTMRSVPLLASRALLRQTERWFVQRGVPLMIADYSFTRHILPRMLPFLAFAALFSVHALLRNDEGPLAKTVAVVGLAVVAAVVVGGRSLRRMPRAA